MTSTMKITCRDARDKLMTWAFNSDDQDTITIARRDTLEPDVNLAWDYSISRDRHARITYALQTWYIEHLSGKRRTTLNGESLLMGVPVALPAECEVIVGETALTITHDEPEIIPDGNISIHRATGDAVDVIPEDTRFEVLSQVSEALATADDDDLGRVMEVIRPYFPTMESGGISVYRDKELFHPVFYPPRKAEISNRLARLALESRHALLWDRALSSETKDYTSLVGKTQAIYAPILRGFKALGVVYLHTASKFTDADLALLAAICEIISANEHFDPLTANLRLPSVFISYSRRDIDFVNKLVADLRRQRATVWFDKRLRVGKDWQVQLEQAIKQSDAFVLVMSPDSLASEWVQWEIEKAREHGKPIFPLWHRECDDVPSELARLQRIDLIKDYQAGVLELAEDLYEISGEEDTLTPERVMRGVGKGEKVRVLFLAANPLDGDRLRLDQEIRTIQERIRGGKYRHQFDMIQQGWAVRFSDLQHYLLEYKPHIVHFSGHGNRAGQIILEDNNGASQPIPAKSLKLLFDALNNHQNPSSGVQLVILNACYSAVQAKAIAEAVGCVAGMSRAVSDSAAIEFAGAFYNALTFGENVQVAFNLSMAAMALTAEEETPQLIGKLADPNNLIFCEEE